MPFLCDAVSLVPYCARVKQISLSDTTAQNRISEMSLAILTTVISEIKVNPIYATVRRVHGCIFFVTITCFDSVH